MLGVSHDGLAQIADQKLTKLIALLHWNWRIAIRPAPLPEFVKS